MAKPTMQLVKVTTSLGKDKVADANAKNAITDVFAVPTKEAFNADPTGSIDALIEALKTGYTAVKADPKKARVTANGQDLPFTHPYDLGLNDRGNIYDVLMEGFKLRVQSTDRRADVAKRYGKPEAAKKAAATKTGLDASGIKAEDVG